MSGMGGLIELVLVFSIFIGWGFIEWRANRRYKAAEEAKRRASLQPEGGDDRT